MNEKQAEILKAAEEKDRKLGLQEVKTSIAKNLLLQGVAVDIISQATSLSIDDINMLS